jgi:hypothetical protein
MKDAWLSDGAEKWYPALVTERATRIRGFDIKPNSTWGRNEVIGRKKISLEDFLLLLAKRSSSSTEHVRCKFPTGKQKNSQPIVLLKFSDRLQQLLIRIRSAS